MVLDKKGILAEAKGQSEEIPFGNGKVLICELSFSEMNAVRDSNLIKKPGSDEVDGFRFVGLVTTASIRNGAGERIFSDADLDTVMAFPPSKYLKLAEASKRLNGMGDDQLKNSEADRTGS